MKSQVKKGLYSFENQTNAGKATTEIVVNQTVATDAAKFSLSFYKKTETSKKVSFAVKECRNNNFFVDVFIPKTKKTLKNQAFPMGFFLHLETIGCCEIEKKGETFVSLTLFEKNDETPVTLEFTRKQHWLIGCEKIQAKKSDDYGNEKFVSDELKISSNCFDALRANALAAGSPPVYQKPAN